MVEYGKRFIAFSLLVLSMFALGAPIANAQITGSGIIQGTITDSTGAVIPKADIEGINVATGVKYTAITTDAGFYVLSPLPPGVYNVSVHANGFKTAVQQNVTVNTVSVVGLDVALQIGQTNQEVTVTAAPPALETNDAGTGGSITNEAYSALPLNFNPVFNPGSQGMRVAEGFIYLLPGVTNAPGFDGTINGGALMTKGIYINGLPFWDGQLFGDNRPMTVQLSVDAVDQFKLISSGIPAQYDGQGVENLQIKAGSNQIHGSAYDYTRNTAFDSRSFFATSTPTEIQNEFGVTVGGPIKKDKMFFFGNFDGFRLRLDVTPIVESIPTQAELQGNFSALPIPIYDPASTTCNSSGACSNTQFAGNIIPPGRVISQSASMMSYMPPPQNSGLTNNILGQLHEGRTNNAWGGRIDTNLSDKQRLFVWYNQGFEHTDGLQESAAAANLLPEPYSSARADIEDSGVVQISHTFIFSPSVLNQVAVQWLRYKSAFPEYSKPFNLFQKANITGFNFTGMPQVNFTGPDAITSWATAQGTSSYTGQTSETIQDNLQWVHGKHNVSVGGQLMYHQTNAWTDEYFANLTFSNNETAGFNSAGALNSSTGNSTASFLLGLVDTAALTDRAAGDVGQRMHSFSTYVADDWKVRRNLTVNLGLRYSIYSPFVVRNNKGSFLNPNLPNPAANGAPGALEFLGYGPDSCGCRNPASLHWLDFAPRFGIAYNLHDRTVVRASYGLSYIPDGQLNGSGTAPSLTGWAATPTFTSPNGGISPAFNWNTGFPAYVHAPNFSPTLNTGFNTTTPGGQGNLTYVDPQLGGLAAYYESWNFAVQRLISPSTTITVAYVGTEGHHLLTGMGNGIYSNQMNPQYLALGNLLTASATSSNIAAAQAQFPNIHLPYSNFAGTIEQMLLPFPQYTAGMTDADAKTANSDYNALQIQAERRFTHGFEFLISATWGKILDTSGTEVSLTTAPYGFAGRTAYNNKLEESVSTMDIASTIIPSFVYQLPFGSGHSLGSSNPVARAILSNWQITGILKYESGPILTPFVGAGVAPGVGGTYADYASGFSGPVRINGGWGSGPSVYGVAHPTQYINPAAFASPAKYTLGGTPRSDAYGLRNPPLYDEDLSVRREFKIRESLRLQFEAQAFNSFNRVEFGGITTNITSGNFGTVTTQQNAPRQIEFTGKLVF